MCRPRKLAQVNFFRSHYRTGVLVLGSRLGSAKLAPVNFFHFQNQLARAVLGSTRARNIKSFRFEPFRDLLRSCAYSATTFLYATFLPSVTFSNLPSSQATRRTAAAFWVVAISGRPIATTSFVVTSAPASSKTLSTRFSFILRALETAALRGLVTWASILPSTFLTSSLSMLSIANWRAWARVMVVLAMVTFFLDPFGPVLSGTLCPSHCLYNTPLGWPCQRLSSLHILTTNLKMLAQANFCGRHKELPSANFWRISLQSNWCSIEVHKKNAPKGVYSQSST